MKYDIDKNNLEPKWMDISGYGYAKAYFKYNNYLVKFTLTDLAGNCGASFLSDVRFYTSDYSLLYVTKPTWGGDAGFISDKGKKELYIGFMSFILDNIFDGRKAIFFSDAIGGEYGNNVLSLYSMSKYFGYKHSVPIFNTNSEHDIVSYWLSVDDMRAAVNKAWEELEVNASKKANVTKKTVRIFNVDVPLPGTSLSGPSFKRLYMPLHIPTGPTARVWGSQFFG